MRPKKAGSVKGLLRTPGSFLPMTSIGGLSWKTKLHQTYRAQLWRGMPQRPDGSFRYRRFISQLFRKQALGWQNPDKQFGFRKRHGTVHTHSIFERFGHCLNEETADRLQLGLLKEDSPKWNFPQDTRGEGEDLSPLVFCLPGCSTIPL